MRPVQHYMVEWFGRFTATFVAAFLALALFYALTRPREAPTGAPKAAEVVRSKEVFRAGPSLK